MMIYVTAGTTQGDQHAVGGISYGGVVWECAGHAISHPAWGTPGGGAFSCLNDGSPWILY